MIQPVLLEDAGEISSEASSPFKIFFLCEDWAAHEKAQRLLETLTHNCQGQVVIQAKFCEFARLCHPVLSKTAREEIEGADLFILSNTSANGLPLFVQKWLNDFVPEKKPMACGAFFQPEVPVTESFVHRFMKRWSQYMGSEFFSNCKFLHQGGDQGNPVAV